jgi:hypothetical protein
MIGTVGSRTVGGGPAVPNEGAAAGGAAAGVVSGPNCGHDSGAVLGAGANVPAAGDMVGGTGGRGARSGSAADAGGGAWLVTDTCLFGGGHHIFLEHRSPCRYSKDR